MHRHHLHTAAILALATIGACQPATHPANYATTIFDAVCHFQFSCCAPSERLETPLANVAAGALDEGRCREEFEDQAGGIFNVAAAAVDNGTATFDADAAERCTAAAREAMASCDSQALLGSPRVDGGSLVFLADPADRECQLLAQRAFVRGTVRDGGDCTADVDCEDFGTCAFLDDDGNEVDGPTRPAVGVCQTPAGEGETCEARGCAFGLSCQDAGDGTVECRAQELLADGEDCFVATQCRAESTCLTTSGTCNDGSGACDSDFDCDGFDAVCEGASQVCAPLEPVDVEICDGL